MARHKIGTKVITPEGEGVVRKNDKHSYRQGVKVGGIRSLRWFWPKELQAQAYIEGFMAGQKKRKNIEI